MWKCGKCEKCGKCLPARKPLAGGPGNAEAETGDDVIMKCGNVVNVRNVVNACGPGRRDG
jgi:hypothetical protein